MGTDADFGRSKRMEALVDSREQALIEECLNGQSDSFEELIRPYQDRLYNTLFRFAGSQEDAAELMQESMIRVFRGLRSYKGESSFYTWLYRISLNVAFTSRRRKRLRTQSTQMHADSAEMELPDNSQHSRPGRNLELAEQKEVIQKALEEIAEPYRAVLVLKDIDDLKYEEIAAILDIPIGTVRSRLHRARAELRDRIKPLMDKGII